MVTTETHARPAPARAPRELATIPSLAALLSPRALAARNALKRGWRRPAVLGLLTIAFWGGSLILFLRVLGYFQTVADFGPMLTQRLLVLLLVTFFGVLLISNTIASLTTLYLADDVPLLLAAPIPTRRLYHARLADTVISSSWMVLLFGLPAFLAYGVVYDAGPLYYLATVATLIPFLLIPGALGVLVTTLLVLLFPARRTRDGLLVLIGLLIGGAFVVARTLRPERLAEQSGLVGFAAFLVGFGDAPSPYLPTTWASEVLIPLLGARAGEPLFHLGMLVSTAAMLVVASTALVEHSYLKAWSRAQEGRVRARGERSLWGRLRTLAAPVPRIPGLVLVKDITVFFRDASQWSQLLLLLALVVIYVFNFSALPTADGTALGTMLRDVAAFCNLALAAFVTTAVAVRFVYPAISLEGRSWWILRCAPIPLGSLWWSKFWIGFVPLLVLSEILVVATNLLLGVGHAWSIVFGLTMVPLIATIVSLGLLFGAAYPRFDTQNAAQIATGFGAIVYMITSLGVITLVAVIEAWPVTRLLWTSNAGLPLSRAELVMVVGCFAAAALGMAVTFALARRAGIAALARLAP